MERKSGRTGWPPDVWATELKKNFNNGTNENSSNMNRNHENSGGKLSSSAMNVSNDLMRAINANNYYLINNGTT